MERTAWTREKCNPESLKMVMKVPFMLAPARFEQLLALHQGHVERVFREDIIRHGGSKVQYGSRLLEMEIDENGDPDFPILAKIERGGVIEEVRSKYRAGADGAKSVGTSMKVEMEGDLTDELWGVIDLVVDSDFPDVRRQTSINSIPGEGNEYSAGVCGGFIIPRERLSNGDFLTRLYLDMTIKEEPQSDLPNGVSAEHQRHATKEKRDRITEELILERAS